jgi:hypothetical protein
MKQAKYKRDKKDTNGKTKRFACWATALKESFGIMEYIITLDSGSLLYWNIKKSGTDERGSRRSCRPNAFGGSG